MLFAEDDGRLFWCVRYMALDDVRYIHEFPLFDGLFEKTILLVTLPVMTPK
jgi:hypothetical protein